MVQVSIIMAAYNAEQFIEETINTVISQTFSDWELIIVNDGSSDGTRQIIERYRLVDKRISIIYQQNKKQAAARNAGYLVSKGDWIIFLDADDIWDKTILQKLVNASQKNMGLDIIYTNGWMLLSSDRNKVSPYPTIIGNFTSEQMYLLQYEFKNYIPIQSALIKRSMIEKIGMQEENLLFQGCEDYDFWIRIASAGGNFFCIDEKLFFYRKHENNMSNNILQMLMARMCVWIKNFEPAYFNKEQPKKLFFPIIYLLVASLIRRGRKHDAQYLLNSIQEKIPSNTNVILKILIKHFGVLAYIPAKIIGKYNQLKFR